MFVKKFQILTCLLIGMSALINASSSSSEDATDQSDQKTQANNGSTDQNDLTAQDDPKLVQVVKEALDDLQKKSPTVQEDSLRVWKNFKGSSKPVNYAYRFWGRQLILSLKDEKNVVFSSKEKVRDVFKILYHMDKISAKAVVVLTIDVWSYLVHLEGMPDWEKRDENTTPGENKKAPDTPV
jgi:hypothetical protein